ncbi:Glu/Leu/Phe/Val dehydrogenase dimerization domain-containing protein [Abyssibacter profundi]|uniref:Amino acid dehydrogenase n=1 Tax=Abyssibacter profundi TaxID=2182787 RepID=A0A363UQ60_9GAMM|nr:Glu/Leu/Phe/Val dehydrogenase dimerization domain-containing protein [Abyssibacter profundi]MBV60008.1 amino acid dehydrogenase [Nevskiales bacterium]PWN57622.1 amino acid dehydrogenase [Abyssibacter profundi]
MSVFDHPEFDQHECVHFVQDERSGLRAIIAVHNTVRGPALGGCRMWPYASSADALTDVLRLSRGMTYKSAMANIDLGGGKSVIIGDPRQVKTDALIRAMGQAVDRLGGLYVAAEDSGTSVDDLRRMGEVTSHVGGVIERPGPGGEPHSGDPSPATALGVFHGLAAAVRFQLDRDDLQGVRVAIQGVGNVGYRLAGHLHAAGAELVVADIHAPNVERAVQAFGAQAVPVADIDAQDVDVFAPCALGSAINASTLPRLKAKVVAGAANNQLDRTAYDAALMERGILYAPDYVINAGGIIDIFYERTGYTWEKVERHLKGIGDTVTQVFERARSEGLPTGQVADLIAESRFRRA